MAGKVVTHPIRATGKNGFDAVSSAPAIKTVAAGGPLGPGCAVCDVPTASFGAALSHSPIARMLPLPLRPPEPLEVAPA